MHDDAVLQHLARQPESELVERKQSRPSGSVVRTTLVAFANSVRPDECAVFFLGIGPTGGFVGVNDADGDQREITRIAEHECYPRVECRFRVVTIENKNILAVMIPHSTQTPHFTGHAYVRKGSESKRASDEQMEKLIAARNTKAGRLIPMLGRNVLIELRPPKPLSELNGLPAIELRQYQLIDCDGLSVTFEDRLCARRITEPLSHVEVLPTNVNGCSLLLLIRNPDHSRY